MAKRKKSQDNTSEELPKKFSPEQIRHLGNVMAGLCDRRGFSLADVAEKVELQEGGKPLKQFLRTCTDRGVLLEVAPKEYVFAHHITGFFAEDYWKQVQDHQFAKQRIGRYVARKLRVRIGERGTTGVANLPPPGLIVDAGTSTAAVVRAMIEGLATARATLPSIHTTNVHAAMNALGCARGVFLPGGEIDRDYGAIVGQDTPGWIDEKFPQSCPVLLATCGITPEGGFGTRAPDQVLIKQALCKKGLTGALIIVADHHKLQGHHTIFQNNSDLKGEVERNACVVIDQLPVDGEHGEDGEDEGVEAGVGGNGGHDDIKDDYYQALDYLVEHFHHQNAKQNRLILLDREGNALTPTEIKDYWNRLKMEIEQERKSGP